MSWAKRYFPAFIVKSFPRVFVEKSTRFGAGKLKSMQMKIRHKINRSNNLQLRRKGSTGQ